MSNARLKLAETIRAAIPTASAALFNAFASVPRERFLPPGPWQMRDASGTRITDDADPAHVYDDVSIAVDPGRDLYNGQPSTVARWFDALNIAEGDRILHLGGGTGYYSAILATMAGAKGHVTTIEVDNGLAASAVENLKDWPHVDVRTSDGTTGLPTDIDVVVIHAGASHVRPEWLACTRAGARILIPLTMDFAAMGPTLGKGLVFVLNREDADWGAKALSFVAIYSMQSARDNAQATTFGQAMQKGGWDSVRRLRTEAHEQDGTCWCHWGDYCLSASEAGPSGPAYTPGLKTRPPF